MVGGGSGWETVGLFPQDHDGQTVHLTFLGTRVSRAGDELRVEQNNEKIKKITIHQVHALVIHGNAQITTQALHLCARQGIPVHWITSGGKYIGGLAFGAEVFIVASGSIRLFVIQNFALT